MNNPNILIPKNVTAFELDVIRHFRSKIRCTHNYAHDTHDIYAHDISTISYDKYDTYIHTIIQFYAKIYVSTYLYFDLCFNKDGST